MGVYLNPGNEGFKRALNSAIYVDKTQMIAYTNSILGTEQGYLCVSRPRRFGKSMTANMLAAYYGRGYDSSDMFSKLNIASDSSFSKHRNQYDVIYLNIQHLLSKSPQPEQLGDYIEQSVLNELKEEYPSIFEEKVIHLSIALSKIFDKVQEHRGFVFIIDEWDCIFREVKGNDAAQKKYLDFLRELLKDRDYVKLAYMTGILPIKKYGTHSALNIFYEYSMIDPKRLAEYVGFTETEVRDLCDRYSMDYEDVKRWYDGYRFVNVPHVYNPKSVVDAMLEHAFKSYWSNTETYEALKIYMDMNFDGLKDAMVSMLGGASCKINPRKFQNDMTTFKKKDDVLTLLVHLGYLAYDESKEEVFIPNYEVAAEFTDAIEETGWNEVIQALQDSEDLLQATIEKQEKRVAEMIDQVHCKTTSILNYNDENALSCVISLAYYSARKEYTLIRELPTGKGFADIVFIPRKNSEHPAMVVELKWDKTAHTAINQIKEKKYCSALEEYKGNILMIGINYDKESKHHTCVIEEQKTSE